MKLENIITHEAQLGLQLANSIANSKYRDFSFLLSLLSTDATDFSVFKQSKSQQTHYSDPLLSQANDSSGPKKPLATSPFNALIGKNNAALLKGEGLVSIVLNECLKPEPLATKNDSKYIEPNIINNCSVITQRKLLTNIKNEQPNREIKLDDFYQTIEKSQKASLRLVA